jgi:hypothetical protein
MSSESPPASRTRLPARWAHEMARVAPTSTTIATTSTSTTGGTNVPVTAAAAGAPAPAPATAPAPPDFDARLDNFLRRFDAALVAARAAKGDDDDDDDRGDDGDNNNNGYHHDDDGHGGDRAAAAAAAAAAAGSFRRQMQRVQAMYAAEGREFADELERRNPAFATALASSGDDAGREEHEEEDAKALARSIKRLEHAVLEEEAKREEKRLISLGVDDRYKRQDTGEDNATHPPRNAAQHETPFPEIVVEQQHHHHAAPQWSPDGFHPAAEIHYAHQQQTRHARSFNVGCPAVCSSETGTNVPVEISNQSDIFAASNHHQQHYSRMVRSFNVGYTATTGQSDPYAAPLLSNLHSDETLCLMQSDIHALKLELMRLQRSKVGGGLGTLEPPPSTIPISSS